MKKYLWLAVTPDEYEFPLYIENSASKLGRRLGISRQNVVISCSKCNGKYRGRKIVKVEVEEDFNEFCGKSS